jgi:hypothetical protein
MNPPTEIPTATRPILLPDLDDLPPILAAKFRCNPPSWFLEPQDVTV